MAKDASDLRGLERDIRPPVSRQLVQLSTHSGIVDNPALRLTLVRALARHEHSLPSNDDIHVEVVRALVRLFTVEDEVGSEADPDPEAGALRHLARGSAAMALARSRHPLALKKLLAVALGGEQLDPVGARLALMALRSLPAQSLETRELESLFSRNAILRITRPEPARKSASSQTLTPEHLVQAAHAKPSVTEEASHAGKPPSETFEALVLQLLSDDSLPRPFAQIKSWEIAQKNEPVWTLRALALLGRHLTEPVIRWGTRTALEATQATSPTERSAAAWCLSIIATDSVPALLKRKDDVMTRAILRQASEGQVAEIVVQFLREKKLTPEEMHLGWEMVLQEPALWSNFSTSYLRARQRESSPAVLAALSSRLRTKAQGLGPDVASVRGWLNSPSPKVRSAAALGLSHASQRPVGGLLFWAYQKESDPLTRRALIASISKTSLARNPEFLDLLAIDPDPKCREMAETGQELTGPGVYLAWSVRRTTEVGDREGRILEVTPAPDGFVGVVRSSF